MPRRGRRGRPPPPSESVRNGRNPERFAPYPGANAPETDPGMRAVSLLGSDAASVCMRVRSEKRVLPTGMPEGFRRVFSEGCEQLPERSLRGLSRQCGKPGRKHRFTGVWQGAVVRTTGYSRTVRRQFSGLLSTDAAFGFAPVRPFKQGTAFRSCPDEVAKRLRTSNRGNRLQSAAP